jgi:hypothetical protein
MNDITTCTCNTHRWFRKTSGSAVEPLHTSLGGSLFLRSVQPADAGVYLCVANSSAGTVSQEVTVRVVPQLSAHLVPASLQVDSGSPAEFLCVTTATHVSSPPYQADGR